MVGNTAPRCSFGSVAPGYIWFPTSAIPDRIGPELAKLMKRENVKSAAIISNRVAVLAGNQKFPGSRT